MKRAILLVAGLLAACGPSPEAHIFVLDDHYRAELLGGSDAGFTSPDGLLWHDGGLLIADEGGSAIRYWRPGIGIRTLAGPDDGLVSPEDIVRERRTVFLPTERRHEEIPVYDDALFTPGTAIEGPAIIDAADTTIYVPPGTKAERDQYMNYVLTR